MRNLKMLLHESRDVKHIAYRSNAVLVVIFSREVGDVACYRIWSSLVPVGMVAERWTRAVLTQPCLYHSCLACCHHCYKQPLVLMPPGPLAATPCPLSWIGSNIGHNATVPWPKLDLACREPCGSDLAQGMGWVWHSSIKLEQNISGGGSDTVLITYLWFELWCS